MFFLLNYTETVVSSLKVHVYFDACSLHKSIENLIFLIESRIILGGVEVPDRKYSYFTRSLFFRKIEMFVKRNQLFDLTNY